jgi:zinc protease
MKAENIKKVVLDNGMTVLVYKNKATPKVLLQIAYDVGSWVEGVGERGLAHLIEHMIFKGTEKLSEGDIDAISRRYGADFNAFTSKDMTSYYFEVDKNNWQPFMPILADCMQNARFDEQHLASELMAVIQELRMYKDQHWNVMLEKASSLIYPSTFPYHYPIIGYKEDLASLAAQNLKTFYQKYYRPEHATLFVVGDIDVDEVVSAAHHNFENIKSEGESTKGLRGIKFPKLAKDLVAHKTRIYEDVKKEQLGFYWTIPGLKERNEIVVSFVAFILGQGEGSRLYRRLVDEERVAVSVGAFVDHLVESGLFLILVEPITGKIEECKRIIQEELDRFIKEGVTVSELNKVIRTRSREFFQRMQSLQGFTYEWIRSYFTTGDEFAFFKQMKEFKVINSEVLQKFVGDNLDPFFMNQIEIVPLPESKRALWQKAKEDSEKLDVAILSKHQRTVPIEEPKFVKQLPSPNRLDFTFPKPNTQFAIDNGLNVLMYKNVQWPIVNIRCQFKDYAHFADSKDGILLDLMMIALIEGSSGYSKKDTVDFFDSFGAYYSYDVVGGVLTALKENYRDVLAHFFHVLIKPEFTQQTLDKLKEIFIDSYQRRKDSQTEVAVRILKNLIYGDHPFKWTFDEAIELLQHVSVEQLQELHKKYVTPQNMFVTVVGDFDFDEMQKNITDIFDDWAGEAHEEIKYPEGKFEPEQVDEVMLRDQVVLVLGQPSSLNIYHEDMTAIRLLNIICFDSLGSRLYQLRERTGLFYTAFGMFAAGATKEYGFNYVGAILSKDTLDEAEKNILGVIKDVAEKGVYHDELNSARQMYLKALIDLTSSNEALGAMFARLDAFELGFDYYDKVLQRVQTILVDELNDIAHKYFVADKMARVRVGRVEEN